MQSGMDFRLSSLAFVEGGAIPEKYSCKGQNVNPPLEIHDVPDGTASLALVFHDLDAPAGDFVHWTVWNLDAKLASLAEGEMPGGALQGTNSFGKAGYSGPCPPPGTHRYVFDLYALDTQLDLQAGANSETFTAAIEGHILARATLVGLFSAA